MHGKRDQASTWSLVVPIWLSSALPTQLAATGCPAAGAHGDLFSDLFRHGCPYSRLLLSGTIIITSYPLFCCRSSLLMTSYCAVPVGCLRCGPWLPFGNLGHGNGCLPYRHGLEQRAAWLRGPTANFSLSFHHAVGLLATGCHGLDVRFYDTCIYMFRSSGSDIDSAAGAVPAL